MRYLLTVLAVWAMAASPAAAQGAAPAPTQQQPQQDDESIEAISGLYNAFLFDSGLYDAIIQRQLPTLRDSVTTSDYYRHANEQHRAALRAFAETIPTLLRDEIGTEVTLMSTDVSPQISGLLSPQDITAVSNFLNSDAGHPMMQYFVQQYLEHPENKSPGAPPMTAQQRVDFAAFLRTPSGSRFLQHEDQLMGTLMNEFQAATVRIRPRIAIRFSAGICDSLGDECPEALRQAAHQT